MVTFNNSVVYVSLPKPFSEKFRFPYYSVPMTRNAIAMPTIVIV